MDYFERITSALLDNRGLDEDAIYLNPEEIPEMENQNFVEALVVQYGQRVHVNLDTLLRKIDLVVTAHIYAGNVGPNFLCNINRTLETTLNDIAAYGIDEA